MGHWRSESGRVWVPSPNLHLKFFLTRDSNFSSKLGSDMGTLHGGGMNFGFKLKKYFGRE